MNASKKDIINIYNLTQFKSMNELLLMTINELLKLVDSIEITYDRGA
jgi:hypothetical protein